jgi:hypothetical protein
MEAIAAARFLVFWCLASFCTDIFRLRGSLHRISLYSLNRFAPIQHRDIPLPYNVRQPVTHRDILVGNFLRQMVLAEDSAFFYASMTNRDGSHIEAIAAACFLLAGMGGPRVVFCRGGKVRQDRVDPSRPTGLFPTGFAPLAGWLPAGGMRLRGGGKQIVRRLSGRLNDIKTGKLTEDHLEGVVLRYLYSV